MGEVSRLYPLCVTWDQPPHFPVVLSPAQAVFIYSGSRSTISSHLSGCCALNKQALNMFSVWLRWELRDFVTKQ